MSEATGLGSVKDALAEGWRSMAAMGGMFVATILLAVYIQPYWDRPEARAFGEAGTTKVGLIGLEFILILVFTFFILWLAKKGLHLIIKWGVLLIFWISLSYCFIPLASYAIDEPEPIPTLREENSDWYEVLFNEADPSTYVAANETRLFAFEQASGLEIGMAPTELWSFDLDLGNNSFSSHPISISDSGDKYVLCDQARFIVFDKETGEIEFERLEEKCVTAVYTSEEIGWAVQSNYLYKVDEYHANNPIHSWWYALPDAYSNGSALLTVLLDDEHMLLVSGGWAGVVEIPGNQHNGAIFGSVNATVVWEMTADEGKHFTSSTWGYSPWSENAWWDETAEASLLVLGNEIGELYGFDWDGKDMVSEERFAFNERGAFDSPIQGLMLADSRHDGRTDLWVASGGEMQMFGGWVMTQQAVIDGLDEEGPIGMTLHTIEDERWSDIGLEYGVATIYGTEGYSSSVISTPVNDPAFIIEDGVGNWLPIYWSFIVALVASTLLMVGLIIHPEWYVVNIAGIATGAGVITIIGVSFVPTIIIIFMIATAIYDAYAVYKSKHMLDLADTMIDLKLPILLVAPPDKDYSYIDDDDRMSEKESTTTTASNVDNEKPVVVKKKTQSSDALLMGLGDVIFPGMLVISALTFLPGSSTILGLSAPMFVAISTLIGGLAGYCVLMQYVALGRPQAGLPLLNGGSILGYLISGLIAVGGAALSFGITIF